MTKRREWTARRRAKGSASKARARSTPPASDATLAGPPQGLQRAFEALRELEARHLEAEAVHSKRFERLREQGSFLVGSVRAAGADHETDEQGLVAADGLGRFLGEAERRLDDAQKELEAAASRERAEYAQARATVLGELEERVERFLVHVRPRLRIRVMSGGSGLRVLHADRPGGDEAVLLARVLAGRLPSRYGFLFDDETEDVRQAPAPLYPDEGIPFEGTRVSNRELSRLIAQGQGPMPIRGFLPVPTTEGFFVLRQRGPVLEAELLDQDAFRNTLTHAESEHLAGHLLRLKLEGRLELEFDVGNG